MTKQHAPDVTVSNHGSIMMFEVNTEAAREWFEENVPTESWQWMGHSLAVEPRYAENLVAGIVEAGMTVD